MFYNYGLQAESPASGICGGGLRWGFAAVRNAYTCTVIWLGFDYGMFKN